MVLTLYSDANVLNIFSGGSLLPGQIYMMNNDKRSLGAEKSTSRKDRQTYKNYEN